MKAKLIVYKPNRRQWPTLRADNPSKTKRFEKYYNNDGNPATLEKRMENLL